VHTTLTLIAARWVWRHSYMDSTPEYFWMQHVPGRIRAAYPHRDPRFLVILRDPVMRAVSQYNHAQDDAGMCGRPRHPVWLPCDDLLQAGIAQRDVLERSDAEQRKRRLLW